LQGRAHVGSAARRRGEARGRVLRSAVAGAAHAGADARQRRRPADGGRRDVRRAQHHVLGGRGAGPGDRDAPRARLPGGSGARLGNGRVPAPRAARRIHRGRRRALPLALVAAFSLVVRAALVSIPLERDEGSYAYVAQHWLAGELPYDGVVGYNVAYSSRVSLRSYGEKLWRRLQDLGPSQW